MGSEKKSDGPEGRRNGFRGDQVRGRTFTTKSKSRGCIVNTCKQNHPPWVCKAFKALPVLKTKELIGNANCYYRCLAAGHHSKECYNAKRCGVDGCLSTNPSSYLHESISHHLRQITRPTSCGRLTFPTRRAAESRTKNPAGYRSKHQ